jgi:hypothetical protein
MFALEAQMQPSASMQMPSGPAPSARTWRFDRLPSSAMSKAVRRGRLPALLERARVVAEEEIDLAAAGEALQGGPLQCGGPVPVATGSRRPGRKRAAVGKTEQTADTEACPGRQVVQAEAERHRAGGGSTRVGLGERLGVVVVSVHQQKLEASPAQQGTGRAE